MSGARWVRFSVRRGNQDSHVWQRNTPVTGGRTAGEAEFGLHLAALYG